MALAHLPDWAAETEAEGQEAEGQVAKMMAKRSR